MTLPALTLLAVLASAPSWRALEPGLELTEIRLRTPSVVGDSTITALRIDPERFELSLIGASLGGVSHAKTAPEWAREEGLIAVTNAGMFGLDELGTPVGYCRAGERVANGQWRKGYGALLVLEPTAAGMPRARILDRDCDDVDALIPKYRFVLQSIRMVSCKRENRWSASPRKWSSMILAIDGRGRLLLIHCRSPYTMRDYIALLLELPLDIQRAMYLEGGPEASLFVSAGGTTIERVGSWETGFNENDGNRVSWALPNVIGVRRRAPPTAQ